MGLYSELLDENRIKKMLVKSQQVLMVTCPGCACESLSYSEDIPCRLIEGGNDMEQNAVAVNEVKKRWDEWLKQMGKTVTHVSIVFPCEMFDDERQKIFDAMTKQDHDTIVILACTSAYIALKDILPQFKGKFVQMMHTKGSFIFRLVKDETGRYSKVERKSARINKY